MPIVKIIVSFRCAGNTVTCVVELQVIHRASNIVTYVIELQVIHRAGNRPKKYDTWFLSFQKINFLWDGDRR